MTLNEKITIKGELAKRGIYGMEITRITNPKTMIHYWDMVSGKPIVSLFKAKEDWKYIANTNKKEWQQICKSRSIKRMA